METKEAETKPEQEKQPSQINLLKTFISGTFAPIAQLKGDEIIDTNDIFDLVFMNKIDVSKADINKALLDLGFEKFDIPGTITKVWLLEEITKTQ